MSKQYVFYWFVHILRIRNMFFLCQVFIFKRCRKVKKQIWNTLYSSRRTWRGSTRGYPGNNPWYIACNEHNRISFVLHRRQKKTLLWNPSINVGWRVFFLLLTNNKYYSLNWIYSVLIIYRAECVDKHENCFVFYSKI